MRILSASIKHLMTFNDVMFILAELSVSYFSSLADSLLIPGTYLSDFKLPSLCNWFLKREYQSILILTLAKHNQEGNLLL